MNSNLNPGPTDPSSSINADSSDQHPSDLALPTTANSPEGLVFIGSTPLIARHIFYMYSRYKDPSCSSSEAINYDFFSFIHRHVIRISYWTFAYFSDAEKITKLGVRKEISDAILDKRLRSVFGTQTLEYWIEDTLQINYETLQRLQDHTNDKRPEFKYDGYLESCDVPDASPEVREGHTILYKAISATSPLFLEDGTLDISTLASPRGNDFNSSHTAVYLSPQRSVAEHFREFISIRCPCSSTYLLSINIPNALLASFQTEELWYGDDWKQFIWHCKTKSPVPEHLGCLGRADLVRGHICTKPPSQIAKLKLQDLEADVSESDIFVLASGEKGIQWSFKEDRFRGLMEGLRESDKMHIEGFGPLEYVAT